MEAATAHIVLGERTHAGRGGPGHAVRAGLETWGPRGAEALTAEKRRHLDPRGLASVPEAVQRPPPRCARALASSDVVCGLPVENA
jgi:hypothetical protein